MPGVHLHEYRRTQTLLLGVPIEVVITTVPGLAYNTRSTQIEVRESNQPVKKLISQGDFEPGYTFILANHVLEIEGVSVEGDQLTLLDKGIITPAR